MHALKFPRSIKPQVGKQDSGARGRAAKPADIAASRRRTVRQRPLASTRPGPPAAVHSPACPPGLASPLAGSSVRLPLVRNPTGPVRFEANGQQDAKAAEPPPLPLPPPRRFAFTFFSLVAHLKTNINLASLRT